MSGSTFRGLAVLLSGMLVSGVLAAPPPALAQAAASSAAAPGDTAAGSYSKEQLDALLAPIALYPDTLLTQVLMASSLPVQVLQARLWLNSSANETLTGDALTKALQAQNWDPSVKSLVPFPQILTMMSDKADWMQQLGYAMSVEQAAVLDSVQRLRRQAQLAGSLTTTPQQKVTTAPPTHPGAPLVILVEPENPQIVYVPSYDPTVVYGPWPYPATPPVYLPPPPGYAIGSALVTGMAFAAGAAVVGSLWGVGRPNWNGGSVNVNANRYNNINVNRPPVQNGNWRPPPAGGNVAGRRAAPVRPPTGPVGSPQRGNGLPANAVGRSSVKVPGGAVNRPAQAPGRGADTARAAPGRGAGAAGANRPTPSGAGQRSATRSPEAFSGMREGRQAPAFSERGAQSRSFGGGGGGGGGARGGGRRR